MKIISPLDKKVSEVIGISLLGILTISIMVIAGIQIYEKHFNKPPVGSCGNIIAFFGSLNQSQYDQVGCFVLAYQNHQKASIVINQHGLDTGQTDFLQTDGQKVTDQYSTFVDVADGPRGTVICSALEKNTNQIKITCGDHELDFTSNGTSK